MLGRPPIYETPAEFSEAVDAYFAGCKDEDGAPIMPTINGLTLALGMTRKCLWDYAAKPEFCYAVEKARSRLEMAWEKRLAGNSCTGAIFWLKNQGWTDKTEQVVTADVNVSNIERRIVHPKD